MLRVEIVLLRVIVDHHLERHNDPLLWYRRKRQALARECPSHVHIDHNKSVCTIRPCLQSGFVFTANQFTSGGFAVGYYSRRSSQDRIHQHTVEVEKPVDIAWDLLLNHKIETVDCRVCSCKNHVETANDTSRHSLASAGTDRFYNTLACRAFDKSGGFGNLVQREFAISGRSQAALC